MVVGDLKQSIYTWRGGNDAPFKEMMSWGSFNDGEFGCCRDSVTSYRYEKNICDFINKVFGPENIRKTLGEFATATGDWLDPDCWKEHKPDVDKGGQPKANDHVKVIGVPDSTNKAKMASLLPALADGLKRIWKEHEETGSTESIGILVRTNDDGKAIAEHLRSLTPPIPVVWEGFSAVSDVPVVNALVDLLRLSEHPEDTFAWKTVSELFPICSTLFAKPKVGDLTAKYVSSIVAKKLSHQGLSRTLQEFSRALSVDSVGLDELSKLRLREMVGVAVAYEERNASRFSLDGFEAFLAASHKRELGASSHVVRILTIHRSKGLTLDRVFVPIAEGVASGIANPGNGGLLYVKDGQWVLPNMSAELLALNPELSRARQEMADDELLSNIRTYYVALTRARKAMYVFLPQPADESAETFFRDVVNAAFETKDTPRPKLDDGNEVIFEQGLEPAFHNPKDDETKDDNTSEGLARQAWEHRGTAKPIERVSPSSAGHRDFVFAGHSASGLFAANAGAAAKKGVEVHGEFERIEWAAAEELEKLPAAFREAFEKPSPEATVWREKSYEIFRADGDKGEWETGQFDRVVFKGTGDDRSAIIYDFKTDARGENESDVAFTDRMRILHQGQMDMYVHALAMLTGIPLERIAAKLLLVSTGTALTIKKE